MTQYSMYDLPIIKFCRSKHDPLWVFCLRKSGQNNWILLILPVQLRNATTTTTTSLCMGFIEKDKLHKF